MPQAYTDWGKMSPEICRFRGGGRMPFTAYAPLFPTAKNLATDRSHRRRGGHRAGADEPADTPGFHTGKPAVGRDHEKEHLGAAGTLHPGGRPQQRWGQFRPAMRWGSLHLPALFRR